VEGKQLQVLPSMPQHIFAIFFAGQDIVECVGHSFVHVAKFFISKRCLKPNS
jgi:hypothetical protein